MYNNACRAAQRIGTFTDARQMYEQAQKVRGSPYQAHLCIYGERVTGKHWLERGADHYDAVMHGSRLFRFWDNGKVDVFYTDWYSSPTTSAFRHAFRLPNVVYPLIHSGVALEFMVKDGTVHISRAANEALERIVAVDKVRHRPAINALDDVSSLARQLIGGNAALMVNRRDNIVLLARALDNAQPWPGVVFGATL